MKDFKELNRGDIVIFKDNDDVEVVMVFKYLRGTDNYIPKRGGGTFNPSDYGCFAFGRREITLKDADKVRLIEQKDTEQLKDQIAYAIHFYNKLHLRN